MTINEAETAGARREYALSGLDGSNLLGFLAALGTLKAVSELSPHADWRMRWTNETGPWRPILACAAASEPADLVAELADYLAGTSNRALEIAENLNIPAATFRDLALEAQAAATLDDHRYADYIAAFGCENAVARNKKGQPIQDTFLRTMSGTGHQHFLGTMLKTVADASTEQLRRSLFEPWRRSDKKLGLRWDPAEYRPYALRWNNPSKEDATTERGANRLAIEALPLLPTAIGHGGLQTTGFTQRRGYGTWISWPIWVCSINIDTVASVIRLNELQPDWPPPIRTEAPPVASVIRLDELQRASPRWDQLTGLGIAAVYRSRRFIDGHYLNFTAAAPV